MKQLIDRNLAGGKPLQVMMMQESIQHLAVCSHAIGPEIAPHQVARALQLFFDEWQRRLGRGRIRKPRQCHGLGLLEGLQHSRGKPGVLLDQGATHTNDMHDREDAGAREIVCRGSRRVRE